MESLVVICFSLSKFLFRIGEPFPSILYGSDDMNYGSEQKADR